MFSKIGRPVLFSWKDKQVTDCNWLTATSNLCFRSVMHLLLNATRVYFLFMFNWVKQPVITMHFVIWKRAGHFPSHPEVMRVSSDRSISKWWWSGLLHVIYGKLDSYLNTLSVYFYFQHFRQICFPCTSSIVGEKCLSKIIYSDSKQFLLCQIKWI